MRPVLRQARQNHIRFILDVGDNAVQDGDLNAYLVEPVSASLRVRLQ